MGCFENWNTLENYDGDILQPKVTTPNDCYILVSVKYGEENLPGDLQSEDLCSHQSGDPIVVMTFDKTTGCRPQQQNHVITVETTLQKDSTGDKAQMVVHDLESGETKTIKKTTNKLIEV